MAAKSDDRLARNYEFMCLWNQSYQNYRRFVGINEMKISLNDPIRNSESNRYSRYDHLELVR